MAAAVLIHKITIQSTDSGNTVFSVDLCGETPQAIFMVSSNTATTGAIIDDAIMSIGASDGTRHGAVCAVGEDDELNWNTGGRQDTTKCLIKLDLASTPTVDTAVSWDGTAAADSYTLQVDDAPPEDIDVSVLVFGGFTNAPYLKQFTITTGGYSPNFAITGVGFAPKAAILFSQGNSSTATGSSTNSRLGIGYATDNGASGNKDQGASGFNSTEASEECQSSTKLGLGGDCCLVVPTATTGDDLYWGMYEMEADGFTIYRANDPGIDRTGWALCFDEVSVDYDTLLQPASGTDQTDTTGSLGFNPHAVLSIGLGFTSEEGTSSQGQLKMGMGMFTGGGEDTSFWHYHRESQATTSNTWREFYDDRITFHGVHKSTLNSLTDETELLWPTTDGQARYHGVLSFTPDGASCPPDDPGAPVVASGNPAAALLLQIGRNAGWVILFVIRKATDYASTLVGLIL